MPNHFLLLLFFSLQTREPPERVRGVHPAVGGPLPPRHGRQVLHRLPQHDGPHDAPGTTTIGH